MDKTVTVIRGGWWLPRRALVVGETVTLDADTADALARRGIVRLAGQDARATPDAPASDRRKRSAKPH